MSDLVFAQTKVANGRVDGLPCSGRITSAFGAVGDAKLPDGTVLHTTGHTGCDIGAALGTEVKAPAAGKVVDVFSLAIQSSADWIANWKRVYGNSVIIQHPSGHYTLYAHLSAIRVHEGMSVVPGATIGLVGSTGLSTGPHLHWGLGAVGNHYLQRDEGLIDPLTFAREPEPVVEDIPPLSIEEWITDVYNPSVAPGREHPWNQYVRTEDLGNGYEERVYEMRVRERKQA